MCADGMVRFRLYVAGTLPNSRRAVANLEAFCRRHLADRHSIEILDVFEEPARAQADDVLLTPQLIVLNGGRTSRYVGDLTDLSALLPALSTPGQAG